MKKQKEKLSAAQKRRLKQKEKKMANKEQTIRQQGNWVEDRLEWIPVDEFYREQEAEDDHVAAENEEVENEERHEEEANDNAPNPAAENTKEDQDDKNSNSFKIVTWNVLADSYCNRSSHRDLPPKYQSVIFDRKKRPKLVRKTLKHLTNKLRPDFFALQEVDPPLGIAKFMKDELDYGAAETTTSKDGRNGRVDACGLYYRRKTWTCIEHETIRLDDLAVLRSGVVEEIDSDPKKLFNRSSSSSLSNRNGNRDRRINSLQGLQCSFFRKNVSLLARLEHNVTKRKIVVVVAHLFWNPAYEYVKLCQMHYIAERAKAFCKDNEPVVLCGDFNAQPNSSVHQYLTKGQVSAKFYAPWYAVGRPLEDQLDFKTGEPKVKTQSEGTSDDTHISASADDLTPSLQNLQLSQPGSNGTSDSVTIKYMLDFTLNRFCRWMRILGLNVALETEEEERERTKNSNPVIFQKCRDEGRVLVTTSSKLVQRKDCPAGTYLLDPKGSLEQTLVHLLLSHGVKIEPNKMLTRCVVCNGSIEQVHDKQKMKQIFKAHNAPDEVEEDVLGVYQCDGCEQGYWWCDKPNSSASRVKNQATRLLELCIRGGVPIGKDLGMFDFVDVEQIENEMKEDDSDGVDHLKERLDIVKWLQNEQLTNPLRDMSSAYKSPVTGEESLPFTNVTSGFVGHLDYIMYRNDSMDVSDLLNLPREFKDLNDLDIPNGHLLPSCYWPSDHLAVGCRLTLRDPEPYQAAKIDGIATQAQPMESNMWCGVIPSVSSAPAAAPPPIVVPPPNVKSHGERCACGCVPAIPSLFEMAELRKQARLRQSMK